MKPEQASRLVDSFKIRYKPNKADKEDEDRYQGMYESLYRNIITNCLRYVS